MALSQKTRYALRAVLELAKRKDQGPAKISEIAKAQDIPSRFLEVILNELKQGGFTDSRRGKEGGYFLARDPRDISVGEVIRFVQGPLYPVEDSPAKEYRHPVPGQPGGAFVPVWKQVEAALTEIFDSIIFEKLAEDDLRAGSEYVPDFMI